MAHVPIWPAGLLRVQGACGSWSKGLALRRRPTLLPALLLAASCCASRSRRRRCYLPHHRSQGQARPVPAKPAAARPQASAPKHRAGPAQQRNTREPKSSSETRLNQNPTPGGQEEDGASIPVEFQYKNSILHGRSLTLDQ